MAGQTYHHGDLRRALLSAAAAAIEENGVGALSMRDLARRAGVSHAAPTHHFGDKAGLLTAFAAQGFDELAGELAASRAAGFLEQGVTYVRFAVTRRAYFEVMYRPELYHPDDPALVAARARAADVLYTGARDAPAEADRRRGEPGGTNREREGQGTANREREEQGTADRERKGLGGMDGEPDEGVRITGQAAWSMAHGFATLWLSGAFPAAGQDPIALARELFGRLDPAARSGGG
ncbi:TetR/AcrR family transcriptional regulator [Actinoplanes sp. URMC 104]|uniref:TetR/AcrR family transcriptional regulator n=1 Tax=Actinoplanes sp. URMC 104 TaxID=3423409 RepID=UPI003F1BD7DB